MEKLKVGAKPKYKEGTKTTKIHPLIPEEVKIICLNAIDKIVSPYKKIT